MLAEDFSPSGKRFNSSYRVYIGKVGRNFYPISKSTLFYRYFAISAKARIHQKKRKKNYNSFSLKMKISDFYKNK